MTNGLGSGSSAASFLVTAPGTPTIVSFNPTSGPPATQVSLAGTDFTGVTEVAFNGVAAGFAVISDARIDATVPSGATTGRIRVTRPAGTGTSSSDFTVLLPPNTPNIAAFSPATGPAGTAVALNGSNFTGASAVAFNGTAATFTVFSGSQIKTTVPAGAITGKITVTTPAGTATSSSDFTVGPVKITSFSPSSGGVATQVTILGSHFTGATQVAFNGVSASFTLISDTELRGVVPVTTSGRITVTTPAGTATSASNFSFFKLPVITSFTPASGPVGTSVTVKGEFFKGATKVDFNGVPSSSFTVRSDKEIRAVVPQGAATGTIGVTTPGGSASEPEQELLRL